MTELQDEKLMILRGQYSTIRAKHEDALKELQVTAGYISSIASQVLKAAQAEPGDSPVNIPVLIDKGRELVEDMQTIVMRIEDLAAQKAELKPLAWPRKKAEPA